MYTGGVLEMPRAAKRDDTAVKVETKIYRRAKQIAAWRDISLAQYLSELLDKPVSRDYKELRKEMGQEENE